MKTISAAREAATTKQSKSRPVTAIIRAAIERRIHRLNDRYQAAKAAGHAEAYKRRAANLTRVYLALREEVEA